MPRRRYIESTLSHKETLNKISPLAFSLWIRMLAISDDFGIVPGNIHELLSLTGISSNLQEFTVKQEEIERALAELCAAGDENNRILYSFCYKSRRFFIFDEESFNRIQKNLVRHRTGSEYLNLYEVENGNATGELRRVLDTKTSYSNLREIPGNYRSREPKHTLSINKLDMKKKESSKGGVGENGHHPELAQPPHQVFSTSVINNTSEITPPADVPAAVIQILHRIGERTGIPAYQNISELSWRPDLLRIGQKIGFKTLLHEAQKFEQWFIGQVEQKKISSTGTTPNPRSRFLVNWLHRVEPKNYSTGDTTEIAPVAIEQANPYADLGN